MAITDNTDLVLHYDSNQLIALGRVLSPSASNVHEHAALCLAIETMRGILMTGINVDDYNNMEEPEPWDTWWGNVQAEAYARAAVNVAAPLFALDASEKTSASSTAGTLFEIGYVAYMANISQSNRVTFTKLGGV